MSEPTPGGASWPPSPSGWSRSAWNGGRFEARVSYPAEGHTVLAVIGDVDMAARSDLDARLKDELARPGCRRLTVDFSRTEFFGSDGLRCLVYAHKMAAERSIDLRLLVNPLVDMVLRASGLAGEFTVERAGRDEGAGERPA